MAPQLASQARSLHSIPKLDHDFSEGVPGARPSAGPATFGASEPAASYRVLTTYLAGTPYPGAHWRQQPQDMNTVSANGSASGFLRSTQRAQQVGNRPPGALEVVPLLCLSTWEHTWLRDYGIGGKKAFAEAWWNAIDWETVADAASIRVRPGLKV
jgi:Fe-Mn family superoxide dismutase